VKNGRRVLGYGAITLGTVSTIVFLSPIFPIGFEAFFIGAIFFGIAYWALAKPSINGILRRFVPRAIEPSIEIDPLLPVQILRMAREREGSLTVSEVAIELNVPIATAEAGLRACVRSGSASEEYDLALGYAQFNFPEFSRIKDESEQ